MKMLIEYNNIAYVVDPETDFLMTQFCYHNGGNCYMCKDAVFGDCLCEGVTIQELLEFGEIKRA